MNEVRQNDAASVWLPGCLWLYLPFISNQTSTELLPLATATGTLSEQFNWQICDQSQVPLICSPNVPAGLLSVVPPVIRAIKSPGFFSILKRVRSSPALCAWDHFWYLIWCYKNKKSLLNCCWHCSSMLCLNNTYLLGLRWQEMGWQGGGMTAKLAGRTRAMGCCRDHNCFRDFEPLKFHLLNLFPFL